MSYVRLAVLGVTTLAVSAGAALAQNAKGSIDGHRTEHRDGSASLVISRKLPTAWETRIGADLALAAPHSLDRPRDNPLAQHGTSSGVAWARAVVPGGPVGVWDRAAVEARVDPHHQEGRVGTRFSRSVPMGEDFSLTVEDGYAVWRPLHAVPVAPGETATHWETDKAVRFNVAPAHTTLSLHTRRSSVDGQWLRSFSAERRLVGPFTVTGTVGETPEGTINRGITAGFTRRW